MNGLWPRTAIATAAVKNVLGGEEIMNISITPEIMADAAYIILKGKVSVFIVTDTGPVEVAELKRGDVVGEISIPCDVPRTASVKAIESVQTLKVTKDTFIHLLTEFPEIAIEIMRDLASRLNKTNIQLRAALTN